MKFTDRFIAGLRATGKKYYKREARGFTIKVTPTGVKVFVYIYTLLGKRQELSLGKYPFVTLAEARSKYTEAFNQVSRRTDPKQEPEEDEDNLTMKTLIEKYTKEWSALNHSDKWAYTLKKTIEKDVLPFWADKKIKDISRRDAITLIERVAARARGSAMNILNGMRSVFTFAVEREYVAGNPFFNIVKAVPSVRSRARERVLSEKEIAFVWSEIGNGYGETKRALKLILVTGQRPGEVAGMHRDEIDGNWWTIPWDRIKSETRKNLGRQPRDHRVYLAPFALELIGDRQGHIFSNYEDNTPLRRSAISRIVSEHKEPYFGLPRWTPHDLRRTARTFMSQLGVPEEHAEAVLNHAKTGMVKVYNLYQYDKEKKEALLRWEEKLRNIIGG